MKKILPAALLLFVTSAANAQDTTGMVAHWKLNGNCLDATGKGHNGTPHNITLGTGKYGKYGTGYYFNGSDSSYITVPYKPDLNLKQYSICATIKVAGFYSGICQNNEIISRGKPGTDGSYCLYFYDGPNDGNNCSSFDSTQDVFSQWAGSGGSVYPITQWQYTPTIEESKWYSVVATYNDTSYQIYVNDTLKSSIIIGHSPMDSTGDSVSIGINIYEAAAGYPYSFNGTIDDIRIYNRVLDSSEVVTYTTSTNDDSGNGGDTTGNGGDTTRLAVNNVSIQPNVLHFYPNPVKDLLHVYFTQPIANASLNVYNQLGQEVINSTFHGSSVHIPVKDLTPGIYFIRVIDGNNIIINRFLKE